MLMLISNHGLLEVVAVSKMVDLDFFYSACYQYIQ